MWLPFHAPELSLATLAPYVLFAIAAILCMSALHLQAGRRAFFLPVCALMIWAFFSITSETFARSPPFLAHCLGIVCIGKFIALPRLLLDSQSPVETLPGSRSCAKVRDAWHVWNNPRNLDKLTMTAKESTESRLLFAVRRICKILVLMVLDQQVVQKLVTKPVIADAQLQDLSADKEMLLRSLLFAPQSLSLFDVQLRLLLPLQWYWMNFLYMERYHDCLAIIFVALRVDSTQSWPPLFGNIAEAYTVKRFWGKCWHRIVALRLSELARPLSRLIFPAGSHLEKAGIAFGIFLFSGLGHAAVAWRLGEGYESRDVIFYVANFAVATAEIVIEKLWRRSRYKHWSKERSQNQSVSLVRRFLGYCWVYTWFVWMLPRWQYPKLYNARYARIEAEIAAFFGPG